MTDNKPGSLRVKIRYYAIFGFLILVLLVNVLGISPYVQWASFRTADAQLTRDYQLIGELNRLLHTVQDIETGQRGYLLTEDAEFLAPLVNMYDEAARDAGQFRAILQKHYDDDAPVLLKTILIDMHENFHPDPAGEILIHKLHDLIAQKTRITKESLRIADTNGFAAAKAYVRTGTGKAVMDDIRAVIGNLIDTREKSSRAMLVETNARMAAYAKVVVLGNLLLGFMLMAAFAGLVTSREQAVRARRRIAINDKQLRNFIRHAPVAIGALDRNLKFVIASDKWAEEFGGHWYKTAMGMKLEDVVPYIKMRPDWQDALNRCFAGETVIMNEDCIRQKGRPDIWARWELYPWDSTGKGDAGIIVLAENITNRKDMEEMKDEFVSTVSHELRTPLTSIRGSLGLVAHGMAGDLPPKARELVDIAHKNSDRLILLINDILDMNKLEANQLYLNMATHDVRQLLLDAAESNTGYAQKFDVSIDVARDSDAATILVDQNRLQQILSNLMSNGIKFSPKGGRLDVGYTIDGAKVRLFVRDYGPGIPTKFQKHIFEKFSQADSSDTRVQGGTGLGLSIAKGLCERMGGCIWFETESGVGSVFFVEFPLFVAGTDDAYLASGHLKKTVLHVEDDPDFFRVMRAGLEPYVMVRNARTIRDARTMIDQINYDLISLDLRLPDGNGLSLLDIIKEKDRCPIVVISAFDVPDDVKPLAAACLIKAHTPENEMIETIMTLLGDDVNREERGYK